ncbi:ubiquitin-protein transferase [Aureococcus anophagefferens]|nr:ubiquitin-protein transferase [Aureococcus anophagefferens]
MAEIEGLVRALREGDDAAKTAAARQLGFLAFNDAANKALIAKAGGIPPLVQLLRDGSVWGKQWAARALGYLAWSNAANKFLIAEAGGIAPLVELLRDGSAQAKEHATWVLNDLALDDNKALIAEAGGIPPLVELLRDGCAVAMHALRRLTLNNDANAVAIAASIGFEAVVKLAWQRDRPPLPRDIKAVIGSYPGRASKEAAVSGRSRAAAVDT